MNKLILFLLTLFLVSFVDNKSEITIYTIGDSTMANKLSPNDHPLERGWGMMLQELFTKDIKVENHAKNGRSSKSFLDEGRWKEVYNKLKPGDYVFIQFGHNDEKSDTSLHTEANSTFRMNLTRYINDTRQRGATPILFTSIVRRSFQPNGRLKDTHGAYVSEVRKLSKELDIVCIDLNEATRKVVENQGEEASKELYMWVNPSHYSNHVEERKDNTHLNAKGASLVARIAVDSLKVKVPMFKCYSIR